MLSDKVINYCNQHHLLTPQDHIVIGVSGGPDSLCLLHLLTSLADTFNLTLTVAHLNHMLRGIESDADEKYVNALTTELNISVFTESQDVASFAQIHQLSLETAARHLRYTFLWQIADKVAANKIAIGHHADDQVETVLMHLLRGSGSIGLQGMVPAISIGKLKLMTTLLMPSVPKNTPQVIRPLLETSRSDIEQYCQIHNLQPRLDQSNQDTRFFRNRIRQELIPYLETYNPNIRQVLQRTAKVVSTEAHFLNHKIESIWSTIVINQTSNQITLNLSKWRNLHLALKRAILRKAIETLDTVAEVGFDHIKAAIDILDQGKTGTKVTLPSNLILQIQYDQLLIKNQSISSLSSKDTPSLYKDQSLKIQIPGVTYLPNNNWYLQARYIKKTNLPDYTLQSTDHWEAYLDADIVGKTPTLRTRLPGDIFYPIGLDQHHKKIKTFMIDQKIPVEQRDSIPLLINQDQVLWICGYRLDHRARVTASTETLLHLKFWENKNP